MSARSRLILPQRRVIAPRSQQRGYLLNPFTVAPPPVTVALLCNFDSAYNIDDSIHGQTGTTSSGTTPSISSTSGQYKFGASALNQGAVWFDASASRFNLADGADFTIDWWMSNILLGGHVFYLGKDFSGGGVGDNSESVFWVSHNTGGGGKLLISPFFSNGDIGFLGGWASSGWSVDNQWTHFALVRGGNTLYYFKDGTMGGGADGSGTYDLTGKTFNHPTSQIINIGGWIPSQSSSFSSGNKEIDGFRFVRKALWTANFTPPTSAPWTVRVRL